MSARRMKRTVGIVERLIARLTGRMPSRGRSADRFPVPFANPPSVDDVDPVLADRLLSGIDAIDWASLEHAYGPATNTPTWLRALLSTDPKVRQEAADHLFGAVTHQGTVYSATAPVTPFLVRLLQDEAGRPIRTILLGALEVIAGGTSYHDVHGSFFGPEVRATPEWEEQLSRELADVVACRRAAAKALDVVLGTLGDPVEDVRVQATSTAAAIAVLPEVGDEGRSRANTALWRVATSDTSEVIRGAAVLSLAVLGADTTSWLDDPNAAVRVTAALSPGLRDEPRAHAILLEALSRPKELDGLFPNGLPQMWGYPRFTVIAAICERIADRDRALPALLEALRLASTWTVDGDRGPMLRYFFPPDRAGTPLTRPQRAFLESLVARPDLWDPANGNASVAFKAVGLPYSADGVTEVLRSGVVPG